MQQRQVEESPVLPTGPQTGGSQRNVLEGALVDDHWISSKATLFTSRLMTKSNTSLIQVTAIQLDTHKAAERNANTADTGWYTVFRPATVPVILTRTDNK